MYLTTLSGLGQTPTREYIPNVGGPTRGRAGVTPEELGRADLDEIFRTNHRLRQRVDDAAKIVGLDPGFLAANLFAEKSDVAVWTRPAGTVASEDLGLDDWFDEGLSRHIRRVIRDSPGINLRNAEVTRTGELWDVSTEKAGGGLKPRGRLPAAKAVIAMAVYVKAQENQLRRVLANAGLGNALAYLTPEQQFTAVRVAVNAGVVPAKNLVKRIRRGQDIPRAGETQRDRDNAVRTAVLHMARGVHLGQAVFGRSPMEYTPAPWWTKMYASRPETTRDLMYRLQRQDRAGKREMSPPPP